MSIKIQANGIKFNNYNYLPVMAKFDNSDCWFVPCGCGSTTASKSCFKLLAQRYGATKIEIREMDLEIDLVRFHYQCNKTDDYYIFYNYKDLKRIPEKDVF